MRILNIIVLTLVIIGGINWGLVGLFDYNLVAELFGNASWITRLVYMLVGASALWSIAFYGRDRDRT